jgi:hypothetical protein
MFDSKNIKSAKNSTLLNEAIKNKEDFVSFLSFIEGARVKNFVKIIYKLSEVLETE